MKKIILMVFILLIPTLVLGSSEIPCGSNKILINIKGMNPFNDIKTVLETYPTYSPSLFSNINNRYELCFEFTEGTMVTDKTLIINQKLILNSLDDKNVFISGLRLTKEISFPTGSEFPIPLLEITNNRLGEIVLEKLYLANTTNGTFVDGSGAVKIMDSEISGDGTGACLLLKGSGHTVQSSKFHGCSEGIRIEGSNMQIGPLLAPGDAKSTGEIFTQPEFDSLINQIFENKIGIHWASGTENRFPYNKVYNSQGRFNSLTNLLKGKTRMGNVACS